MAFARVRQLKDDLTLTGCHGSRNRLMPGRTLRREPVTARPVASTRHRPVAAILPKGTGDGYLSRPPSRRGRTQARLVVASSAALTLVSAAPNASAWIGFTGGRSAHRPALGRALGGRDALALWGLSLRLSLLLALIAL